MFSRVVLLDTGRHASNVERCMIMLYKTFTIPWLWFKGIEKKALSYVKKLSTIKTSKDPLNHPSVVNILKHCSHVRIQVQDSRCPPLSPSSEWRERRKHLKILNWSLWSSQLMASLPSSSASTNFLSPAIRLVSRWGLQLERVTAPYLPSTPASIRPHLNKEKVTICSKRALLRQKQLNLPHGKCAS